MPGTPAAGDSRALLQEDLSNGSRHLYSGDFATAVPHLHGASWLAAHFGPPRERLDVQMRLGDAQLQAREFQAALASYRAAEQLAEELVPDSGEYWLVRASIAQALRRTGRIEEARRECAAIRSRLLQGALAPPDGRATLVAHMIAGLQAQLDAMVGDFEAASAGATTLADRFLGGGDPLRAANQLYNAAQWLLCQCERDPSRWGDLHARALGLARRAGDLMRNRGRSAEDEMGLDLELLAILADCMEAKMCGNDAQQADEALERAQARLDRILASHPETSPTLRFQIAILGLRLAERAGDPTTASRWQDQIRLLLVAHRPSAQLWARQDLTARFHWDRDVVPLGRPDPDLERLLAEVRR